MILLPSKLNELEVVLTIVIVRSSDLIFLLCLYVILYCKYNLHTGTSVANPAAKRHVNVRPSAAKPKLTLTLEMCTQITEIACKITTN